MYRVQSLGVMGLYRGNLGDAYGLNSQKPKPKAPES